MMYSLGLFRVEDYFVACQILKTILYNFFCL